MNEQRGLVVHIASGFYEGTISWQKNPDADVSSHFVTGRDDSDPLAQMVDTDVAAWTQRDGNGEWMSIECEGFATGDPQHDDYPGWERLTDHQMDQVAQVFARGAADYGWPMQLADHPNGRGLGRAPGGRHGCPARHARGPDRGTALGSATRRVTPVSSRWRSPVALVPKDSGATGHNAPQWPYAPLSGPVADTGTLP
jgi:hypothetical protein